MSNPLDDVTELNLMNPTTHFVKSKHEVPETILMFRERQLAKSHAVELIADDWPLGSNFDWKSAEHFCLLEAGVCGDVPGVPKRVVLRAVKDGQLFGPPLSISTYIPEGYEPGD